jgi:hypothetical protein
LPFALFGMTDASFHASDEELHYPMARYACQWLHDRGKLWPFYRRWRDGVTSDPTGENAFAQVMGTTPSPRLRVGGLEGAAALPPT